jgi:NitT/TauT family transport system substrate-binding protein
MNKILILVAFFFGLAARTEARNITVGVPVLDVSQSALFIAKDKGYYRQEGLDVELILMRGGVANQALIAGGVDFTTVPTAGLAAALQGAALRVLFTTFHRPLFWLYSRPEIGDIKALNGKKVAVSSLGAAGDSVLRELLKNHGLEGGREVAILAIGVTATRLTALSNGAVDAAMLTFPQNISAKESGLRELVSFLTQDIVQLQGSIVVRETLLQSEPLLAEKFLRGTIKGFKYFTGNRRGAITILARNWKTPEDTAAKLYDLVRPAITPEGILNDDLQKKILAPLLERSGRRETPAMAKFFDFDLARKVNAELKADGWKP